MSSPPSISGPPGPTTATPRRRRGTDPAPLHPHQTTRSQPSFSLHRAPRPWFPPGCRTRPFFSHALCLMDDMPVLGDGILWRVVRGRCRERARGWAQRHSESGVEGLGLIGGCYFLYIGRVVLRIERKSRNFVLKMSLLGARQGKMCCISAWRISSP
jgi:hypothetical protein